MGVEIEPQLNEKFVSGREGIISKNSACLKVYVIPTNEELLIARATVRLIGGNESDG
jgi:acetate kinase